MKIRQPWFAALQSHATPQPSLTSPSAALPADTPHNGWRKWYAALQSIFPTYLLIHLAFLALTLFAPIINFPLGDNNPVPLSTLWQSWLRWDVAHYLDIATKGYDVPTQAAFFPLYPLLMKMASYLIHNTFIAGVIISNIALLVACTVFYQLVREDFGEEQADRTILYLVLFPSAFFLVTAYSESLFFSLAVLCFYHIRHGRWWLAGLFGFFAILTRSIGICLLLPFLFEYVRQHQFKLRSLIRLDLLSMAFIPAGLAVYGCYCYIRWGDFFAFSKQEAYWDRTFHVPWEAFVRIYLVLTQHAGFVRIPVLHDILALSIDIFVLTFIILGFIGPWRLPRTHLAYNLYALLTYLVFHCSTVQNDIPLESMVRYLMSIFPIFIMFSIAGKHRLFHRGYLMLSSALLFFSTLLFLSGHWMT